jgi:aspartate/methionine/tyrosine aminotransferase
MRGGYKLRRDVAVAALRRAGRLISVPRGAFYILADVSDVADDTFVLARSLVVDHGLAIAPGATFGPGGAGTVRFSLASPAPVIEAGVGRLIDAIGSRSSGSIRGSRS